MAPEVAKQAPAALRLVSFFLSLSSSLKTRKVKPHASPFGCPVPAGQGAEVRENGPGSLGNVAPQQLPIAMNWREPRAQHACPEPGPVEGSGPEMMLSDHMT